jgi:hypothetical protein
MFLIDAYGKRLINTADIVQIVEPPTAGKKELPCIARLRDGEEIELQGTMMQIYPLLQTVLPAAPGYEMLSYSRDELESTEGRAVFILKREAVIGWRIGRFIQPVTLEELYDGEHGDWAVRKPDGRVTRPDCGEWADEDEWFADMQRQYPGPEGAPLMVIT